MLHRYHTVFSEGGRNLAVNTWWWRSDKLDSKGSSPFECSLASESLTLADCSLGYEMYSEDWTSCNKPGQERSDEGGSATLVAEPESKIINWIQTSIEDLKRLKARKTKKRQQKSEL